MWTGAWSALTGDSVSLQNTPGIDYHSTHLWVDDWGIAPELPTPYSGGVGAPADPANYGFHRYLHSSLQLFTPRQKQLNFGQCLPLDQEGLGWLVGFDWIGRLSPYVLPTSFNVGLLFITASAPAAELGNAVQSGHCCTAADPAMN